MPRSPEGLAGVMAGSGPTSFAQGFRDSIPVAVSFFFLFLAVGGASKVAGLTPLQSTVMSVVVFAAPAQFAIFDLMARQRPWLDLVAVTALINSRFFVMAAALLPYFRGIQPARILLAMPMLSASTFALPFMRFRQGAEARPFYYYLGVAAGSYPVAVAATSLGVFLVHGLADVFVQALKMILPVYFSTLLAREWPKPRPLVAGLLGFALTPLVELIAPAFGMLATAGIVGAAFAALDEGRHG